MASDKLAMVSHHGRGRLPHTIPNQRKGAAERAFSQPREAAPCPEAEPKGAAGRTFSAEKGAEERTFPPSAALSPHPQPDRRGPVVHDGLVLEDVLYRLSDGGGGSAGQTKLDLLLDGATLSPSFAQEDHRPAWPFDTAALLVHGRIHERLELHPGQLLQLVSIEHPTGGTPARAEAYLLCRRP